MRLTEHSKAHDHTTFKFNSPRDSLQMSFKGPHNFMVIVKGGPKIATQR